MVDNILTDREWTYINNTVGKIYSVDSFDDLGKVFLLLIRKLIPYKYALFALMKKQDNVYKIDLEHCVVADQDTSKLREYNERFVYDDFTNHVFAQPESTTYRDTDIVNEELLINSKYYREYRVPHKQKYDGGLMVKTKTGLVACVTLMRDEMFEALSDKEIYILEAFIKHMEFIIDRLLAEEERPHVSFDIFEQYENLSSQEKSILPYILCGYPNKALCQEFNISESIAKKHIHSILQKLDCKNKGVLLNKFLIKNGMLPKNFRLYEK